MSGRRIITYKIARSKMGFLRNLLVKVFTIEGKIVQSLNIFTYLNSFIHQYIIPTHQLLLWLNYLNYVKNYLTSNVFFRLIIQRLSVSKHKFEVNVLSIGMYNSYVINGVNDYVISVFIILLVIYLFLNIYLFCICY